VNNKNINKHKQDREPRTQGSEQSKHETATLSIDEGSHRYYKTYELKRYIWITFKKEGIHKYPDAPEEVKFLRYPHRHIFHFKVKIEVEHNNRDIEFIMLKRELENLYDPGKLELDYKSCEMLAEEILDYLLQNYSSKRSMSVEVSEDGENGAVLEYKPLTL